MVSCSISKISHSLLTCCLLPMQSGISDNRDIKELQNGSSIIFSYLQVELPILKNIVLNLEMCFFVTVVPQVATFVVFAKLIQPESVA